MKAQSNEKKNWLLSISAIMAGMLLLIIPYLKTTAVPKYTATNVTVNVSGDHIQIKGKLNISNNVREVYFPTWRILDNQKDLKWWKGTRNGTEISATIDMKDHGYVAGEYVTHIYVVDQTGYVYVTDVTFQYSKKQSKPTFTNEIFEDNSGYRIIYTVANSSNIDHLDFPTWTEANGQDDIIWYRANRINNTFTYDVKRKNHNDERGIYYTDAYIYYADGIVKTERVRIVFPVSKANVSSVSIELDQNGYNFNVVTQIEPANDYQVDFAVWTEANGQDDIIWRKSSISQDDHYFFWGKRSEHNNENGIYHIHAYIKNRSGDCTVFETKIDYTKPLPKLISIKHNNVTDKAFDIVYQIEMPEGIDIASAVSPTWSYADVPSNITWNQPTIQWSGRTATITCHHNAADGKQKYYSHLHLQDSLGRKMIYGTELYLK